MIVLFERNKVFEIKANKQCSIILIKICNMEICIKKVVIYHDT